MRQISNSRLLQTASAFLASTLLLSAFPLSAFASSNAKKSESQDDFGSNTNSIIPDYTVSTAPFTKVTSEKISAYNIPMGMTLSELTEKGYTERVYGLENDLNSIVLSDKVGNMTLFYYDQPVKYIDEYGFTNDKILSLVEQDDGSYRTRQSDIMTTFSPSISDGIKLERDNQSIRLTPLETEAQAALTSDCMSVAYAVDDTTRYEYTLTPMGFKEDIIVESYTGQTEYSFLLETDGLSLVEEYGTYHLVDEYNTVQAFLGEIILFTADDRNNTFGQMQAQTIEEGQEYLLTVELDENWLSDPDTHYPITVDPTINYSTSGNIEDVSIVSTTTHAGDSGSLYVGRGSSGAALRSLMRFPNLNIRGYSVTKATVSIRELLCEDTVRPVECREFTGNSWSESGTTTWSGVGSSAGGTLYGTYNVCYDEGVKQTERHRYVYDITALAKKWAAGTSSPAKGLVFRSTDSYETSGDKSYCAFASINRGSNPPMLTVEYTITPNPLPAGPTSGVYAFKNAKNTKYMKNSQTVGGYYVGQTEPLGSSESPIANNTRSALFKVIYRSATQDYIIRSMMNSKVIVYANTKLRANQHTGYPLTRLDSNSSDANVSSAYTWNITQTDSNSYYIWYQPAGSTTRYYLTMPESGSLILTSSENSATKWVLNESSNLIKGIEYASNSPQIIASGDSRDLSNYTTDSCYYSSVIGDNTPGSVIYIVSDITGSSTSVATINSNGMLKTVSGKAGMIRVTAAFAKGVSFSKNYYVEPTSGEYFFLQNIQPSGGINIGYIDGDSTGATKKALTYEDTQLWQRIPSSWSGYYYIKNVGTGLYLSSPSDVSVGAALTMVSTVTSDLQAWQFSRTSSNAWKIRARPDVISGTNLYINIKSTSNNTLVQEKYVQNSNYLDEFNVVMLGSDVVYHRTLEGFDKIDPSITIAKLAKYYDSFTLLHQLVHFGTESPTFSNLALDYLQKAKVMIFNGHASPTVISVSDKPQKYLRNTEIYDPSKPEIAYKNVDIVIFAGCSSGGNICNGDKESPNFCCPTYEANGNIHNCNKLGCACCATSFNLPKSAELAGAKVAIGWHVDQWDNNMNYWIDRFMSYMCEIDPATGKLYTAQVALDKANADTSFADVDTAILYGTNPNFRFN